MKAIILTKPQTFEIRDIPPPSLTDETHVLIKVESCGICGSDLRYWKGDNPWALHTLGKAVPNPPNIILGHEFAGTVVESRSARFRSLVGRRVGAQAFRTCGKCRFCQSNRENLCRETIHLGHAQGWGKMDYYPGAYAEYCVAWGDLVFPIPDDVPTEDAAMADVVCVGVHAIGRCTIYPGANILCIGGGPIGFCAAQVALASGAAKVFVSEPAPVARHVLEQLSEKGIVVIDPTQEDIADVLQRTDEGKVSSIIDSVGSPATLESLLPFLEESGTYLNLAVHDVKATVPLLATGSERTITTSSNALYRDVARAYELLYSRHVDVRPMFTHRLPLEQFQRGFELLLREPKEAYKVLLNP